MLKKICGLILLAALSAACAGSDNAAPDIQPYADEEQALHDGLPPLDTFEQGDIGKVEQALGAKTSTTYQYGTRTATSGSACNKTSTGQECYVPQGTGITGTVAAKVITWRLTPLHGFNATEQTAIQNAITAEDNTLSAWSLSLTTAAAGHIQLANAAVGGGSGSSTINAFVETSYVNLQSLNEQSGVVGTYRSASNCLVKLDIADINTRGAAEEAKVAGDQGETGKLRTHAILVGVQRCLGLGSRDDASSAGNYIDITLMFPGPLFRPLQSTGDQCRANSYDPFSAIADYNNLTPACAD
jgi:hypothetical protein